MQTISGRFGNVDPRLVRLFHRETLRAGDASTIARDSYEAMSGGLSGGGFIAVPRC
jgi:hypothetical protein